MTGKLGRGGVSGRIAAFWLCAGMAAVCAPAFGQAACAKSSSDAYVLAPIPPTMAAAPAATPAPTAFSSAKPAEGGDEGDGAAASAESVPYAVNFDYLRSLNSQAVGWLYEPGGAVNLPVARGVNNEYYQKRTFDRAISSDGSVYMDCANAADFSDPATFVYGSGARENGSFASLWAYEEQAYYAGHSRLFLLTPAGDYQVDLFAAVFTAMNDDASWRVPACADESEWNAFVASLTAQSLFTAPAESLPRYGDRLLALVGYSKLYRGRRLTLYGRMRPAARAAQNAADPSKMALDRLPTHNGYVSVAGVGSFLTYAQNDELWGRMRYENKDSEKRRRFEDGGCGPTAVAMAIARLVEDEELPKLAQYAALSIGYTFCECSVNSYRCNHRHVQYHLETPAEFKRYLPLAIANFASGNNQWGILSRTEGQGTNMRYLDKLCEIYDISVTGTRVASEAVAMLREGGGSRVGISCAIKGSPFTSSSHFVVLAAVDDQYLYVLDPLRNNDYDQFDKYGYVEQLAPGVVRIRLENTSRLNLSPLYILEKNK